MNYQEGARVRGVDLRHEAFDDGALEPRGALALLQALLGPAGVGGGGQALDGG